MSIVHLKTNKGKNKAKQSNSTGIFMAEHFPRSTCKKLTTMEPLSWKGH